MHSPLHPLVAILVIGALGSAQSLQAAETRIVTNTSDSGTGSLRAAIAASVNGDSIAFDPALNDSTITLTTGQLSIAGLQVTIDASSLPSGVKISGNSSSRIFEISANSIVTLNKLDILHGNSSGQNGGGIAASQSQLNCIETTVRGCVSTFDGGGLWANTVTGTFDRCSFLGNDAGGFGGGVFFIGTSSPAIQNSVVSGNRSAVGGGIAFLNASPTITNCTIQGNSGTGVQLEFASAPIFRNTIVWGNRSGDGSIASQQIRNGNSSTASANVNYCLVEGVASTLNNLNGTLPADNPMFIAPASPTNSSTPPTSNTDLRVFTSSPVLNAGDNGSNSTLLDRAGKTRSQGGIIDLGAFESGYVTFGFLHPALSPSADENGNGLSNFLEYATGIDPASPDDPSARPAISNSGGFRFLAFTYRTNAADVKTSWETSTSLGSLSWQQMISGINYSLESTLNPTPFRQEATLKLLDGDAIRFYRQAFLKVN